MNEAAMTGASSIKSGSVSSSGQILWILFTQLTLLIAQVVEHWRRAASAKKRDFNPGPNILRAVGNLHLV